MNLIALALALASLSSLAIDSAAAQVSTDAAAFPNRSIKIVVPFPAGGPSDVLARMIGQKMSEDWGQPVVIENRVGANTVLGAQQVAKAAPDGYTLLMAIDSTLTMNQYLYRNPPYDPFTDFVPITLTGKSMVFMYVNASSDYRSVKDVIASAKAQPGKLNYGAGTITSQLMGHLLDKAAGIKTVLLKYNGSAQVAQGLLTKSVDFTFDGTSASMPLVQGGPIPRPGEIRQPSISRFAERPDHHRRAARLRGDHGVARAGRAQGDAGGDRRQASRRGGEDPRRSCHQGEGGCLRAVPGHQHAGGIRRLHPQGGRAMVRRGERNRIAVRLIRWSAFRLG